MRGGITVKKGDIVGMKEATGMRFHGQKQRRKDVKRVVFLGKMRPSLEHLAGVGIRGNLFIS